MFEGRVPRELECWSFRSLFPGSIVKAIGRGASGKIRVVLIRPGAETAERELGQCFGAVIREQKGGLRGQKDVIP